MILPKWATTVTPLSKTLALIIFTFFPIIAFCFGMNYQSAITQQKVTYITNERIVKVPQIDTDKNLITRCGIIPDAIPNRGHFEMQNGPMWSPDCRYVSWSMWKSGPGYSGVKNTISRQLSEKEGVFLFNDATKRIIKIYSPKQLDESPTFVKWLDRSTIELTADKKTFHYDLKNNQTVFVN